MEGTGTARGVPERAPEARGRTQSDHVDDGVYLLTPLAAGDIDAVARLHVASFGDSFLATLGVAVLRHYYRTFLDYPEACSFVCRHRPSGTVVGFVCGTESHRRHYRTFLWRRLLPALPALAGRALGDGRMALGLLRRAGPVARIVARRRPAADAEGPRMPLPQVHLMSMAVHPDQRRNGVGELLVRAFTAEMARRGVRRIVLGVREENGPARRLYERLGWRPLHAERALDGSLSWLYLREVAEPKRTVGHDASCEASRP